MELNFNDGFLKVNERPLSIELLGNEAIAYFHEILSESKKRKKDVYKVICEYNNEAICQYCGEAFVEIDGMCEDCYDNKHEIFKEIKGDMDYESNRDF